MEGGSDGGRKREMSEVRRAGKEAQNEILTI